MFEIGSITKTFTCTLLSDLVLHDGLALSDPVQRYLPEDVVMPTRSGNVITLQHLATHTSGLPFLPTNMEVGNAVSAFADYTVTDQYDFLANYRLPRDPGTQWEYSDLGVGLLGHVLARQTGNDYESLVKDRIARVLDMPDTRITLTPDQQRRRVRGYAGVAARQYMTCPVLPGCVALRSIGFHLLEPSSPLDTDPVPAAIPLENVQGCVGRYYLNANDFFDLTLQQGPLTFVHSSDPSLPFTLYPSSPWAYFLDTPTISATAAFQTNAQGLATSMLWTQTGQAVRYPKVTMPAQLSLQHQDQKMLLSFTGDVGIEYVVEASGDLAVWTPISTNTIWNLPVVDAAGDQLPHRFYRVKRK